MSHDLLAQLSEYGTYCDERQGTVTADDITDAVLPLPMPTQPTRPRHGWLIAAAAAAVVLLLAGGLALLGLFGGDDVAPVNEPAVTTTQPQTTAPATTVPASEPVATTTGPQTTLPVAPVVPPGEGPKLEFVPVELPSGEWLRDGIWFQGALYAISANDLFRSSDGYNWELLPGSPDVANPHQGSWGLETSGGLLVHAGSDLDEGSRCALPGDAIIVRTSIDGASWKTSRIDLPIPDSSTTFGCYSAFSNLREGLAVGPQGIMITALIQGEIVAESIFEAEFGLGLDPETLEMGIGGGFLEVTTADGEVYEIDLEAAGYLDDIENWLGVASADPNFAELALNGSWHTGKGYAWFSPDGQTWSQLDASGPLDGGEIAAVVATAGGFVATSTSSGSPSPPGPAQDILWESTDGTTWTQRSTLADSHLSGSPYGLDMWDGRLVAVMRKGVWTIEDTPQQLITASMGVMEIGEFGLIGLNSEMDGGGTEVLFSADGTTWNRWTPPEFGPEFGTIYVVGIGDDFVVLRLITQAGESHWVGGLP